MGLRRAHGAARRGGKLRVVEVPPIDELADGVAGPDRTAAAEVHRDAHGRIADRQSAAELGRRGGLARAGRTALAHKLSIAPSDPTWEPYRRAAEQLSRALLRDLARLVGGGEVGPGPGAIAVSAALQMAASRRAFDAGRDAEGSRLAVEARQSIIAARELAALDGEARERVEQREEYERQQREWERDEDEDEDEDDEEDQDHGDD